MSKRKAQARRRKAKAKRKARDARTPAALLGAVALALSNAERAGLHVRLRHGAVFTFHGVVIPPERKGQSWVARPFGVLPQSPAREDGSDED